ncbi:MAG: NAD(P)-dependent oxidoreductase [Chloroflexi bacterium]|nr:MAG: NAD(P)-dependent oxidoreductase [Chloroflexota bacterium]
MGCHASSAGHSGGEGAWLTRSGCWDWGTSGAEWPAASSTADGRSPGTTCPRRRASTPAAWACGSPARHASSPRGDDGVLDAMPAGAVLIETSTIDPHTMEQVGREAQGRGVRALDVTLSGEPPQAAQGQLVFMVGGDEALLDSSRPLLETLSRTIHHTGGGIGTAKTVKLVNNLMSLSNIAAAAEAFVLGVKCGMEPQRLFDILSTSGGRSAHFIHDWPGVLQGDYRPGFKTSLAAKDIGLILDLAAQERYAAVVAPVIARLYGEAVAVGSGEEHFTSLVKLFESRAGISVQPARDVASARP